MGGDSARGNLAAVAAIAACEAGIALRGQVLIYSSMEIRPAYDDCPSRKRYADPTADLDAGAYFHGLYMPDAALWEDWNASPILVPETAGLAPVLIVSA